MKYQKETPKLPIVFLVKNNQINNFYQPKPEFNSRKFIRISVAELKIKLKIARYKAARAAQTILIFSYRIFFMKQKQKSYIPIFSSFSLF